MRDPYMTATQAARVLGISRPYVHQLAERGRLRTLVTPLGRLFSYASVADECARRGLPIPPMAPPARTAYRDADYPDAWWDVGVA